ncbi:tubulin-tyrosine ligase family-domain-containing protein [Globomyces pollinis-pini]|nr:tubulin-tyrosine ligase family-domain-containing protein [Globomyces pollinis-pini]
MINSDTIEGVSSITINDSTSEEDDLFDNSIESTTNDTEEMGDTNNSIMTEEDFDLIEHGNTKPPEKGSNELSPIWPSEFPGSECILYFPKEGETVGQLPNSISKYMKWKSLPSSPKVVRHALLNAHFKLVNGGDQWLSCWGKHLPLEKFKKYYPWQRVNHFPLSFEIGRKDKLYLNFVNMQTRYGVEDFDYIPESYILPRSRQQLDRVFSTSKNWILKPPASARGLGIKVISKMVDVPRKKDLICSKYIANPYLINGRKFDLRLYVLVTSFDPLRVYFYKHGLARFASEEYFNTNVKRPKYRFSHLTNYSINKKNKKQVETDTDGIFGSNSRFDMSSNKWSLETLKDYLELNSIDFDPIMKQIHALVVKTMISVQCQNSAGVRLHIPNRTGCYELFGFDVLLDVDLKPWLMEVNISPALKGSCDMDYKLKSALIVDIFNTVGFKVKDIIQARTHVKKKPPAKKQYLTNHERAKHRAVLIGGQDCLTDLTAQDYRMLIETEEENNRKGEFIRLWPSVEFETFSKYFISFNYFDRLIHTWTCRYSNDHQRVIYLRKLLNASIKEGLKLTADSPRNPLVKQKSQSNGLQNYILKRITETPSQAVLKRISTNSSQATINNEELPPKFPKRNVKPHHRLEPIQRI